MAKGKTTSLPAPPPPHPFPVVPVQAGDWFRVHRFNPSTGRYGPTDFNPTNSGNARFSPLINPDTGAVIPTIYAAQTSRGAISEIVLHDAPTPSTGYLHDWEKDKAGDLHLSRIRLDTLALANLTSTGMKAAGLEVSDLFESEASDYPRTRSWAVWIWKQLPSAQGLYWMSRRDNSSKVLMLFGDRIAPSQISPLAKPNHIAKSEDEVLDLLIEMGAGIMPVI